MKELIERVKYYLENEFEDFVFDFVFFYYQFDLFIFCHKCDNIFNKTDIGIKNNYIGIDDLGYLFTLPVRENMQGFFV